MLNHKSSMVYFAGFTGQNCSTNINDCPASYCQPGGTCVDGIAGGFSCNCSESMSPSLYKNPHK